LLFSSAVKIWGNEAALYPALSLLFPEAKKIKATMPAQEEAYRCFL